MAEDLNVIASAGLLLEQHGMDAWFVASQRANAHLAQGEMAEHRSALRILNAILRLEAVPPSGMAH